MKLKYFKPLLLILAVVTLSSCWWDDDKDRAIDQLTDYEWTGNIDRSDRQGPLLSKFTFSINGRNSVEGLYELLPNGRIGKFINNDNFDWRWYRDGFYDVIELRYGPRDSEFFDEVEMDYRRNTLMGVHYLSVRDFEDKVNGYPFILEGRRF